MKYTIQIFKSNAGTEASHRITLPYIVEAESIPEAYAKAKIDFIGYDITFGFILPAELDMLPVAKAKNQKKINN